MADEAALTDMDRGSLIQGAAFTALSPWGDRDDDSWRDQAADQVRDAVLTALMDAGWYLVTVDPAEREEWKALEEADTLHMLPIEAHIACVKYLAARLLDMTDGVSGRD